MTKLDLKDPKLLCDKAYINGAWQNSHSGDSFEILNPATGEVIIKVARCGQAETTEAIAVAQTAFETWQHVGAKERSALLMKWHDHIIDNIDDLALILTMEMGKPLS